MDRHGNSFNCCRMCRLRNAMGGPEALQGYGLAVGLLYLGPK
jgi:hypothetical protein